MQKLIAKHPYITKKPGISKGSPIIAGTRVRVLDIVIEYEYLSHSPDEIISAHPHLILPQIHDALSFYYEHREEMDQDIRSRKEAIVKLREKFT